MVIKYLILFIFIITFYNSLQCSTEWPKKNLQDRCIIINNKIDCNQNEGKILRFLG